MFTDDPDPDNYGGGTPAVSHGDTLAEANFGTIYQPGNRTSTAQAISVTLSGIQSNVPANRYYWLRVSDVANTAIFADVSSAYLGTSSSPGRGNIGVITALGHLKATRLY